MSDINYDGSFRNWNIAIRISLIYCVNPPFPFGSKKVSKWINAAVAIRFGLSYLSRASLLCRQRSSHRKRYFAVPPASLKRCYFSFLLSNLSPDLICTCNFRSSHTRRTYYVITRIWWVKNLELTVRYFSAFVGLSQKFIKEADTACERDKLHLAQAWR